MTTASSRAIAQALDEAMRVDRKKGKKSADGSGKAKDKPGKKSGRHEGQEAVSAPGRDRNPDGTGDDRG